MYPMCWNQELLGNLEVTWPALTGSIGELREFDPSCRSCFPVLLMHFVREKPISLDFIFWMLCSVCHLKWLPSFAFPFSLHIPEMSMTKDLANLVSSHNQPVPRGQIFWRRGLILDISALLLPSPASLKSASHLGKNNILSGGLMTHLVKLPGLWWSCLTSSCHVRSQVTVTSSPSPPDHPLWRTLLWQVGIAFSAFVCGRHLPVWHS